MNVVGQGHMRSSASLNSKNLLELTQIRLDKLQLYPQISNFCAEFLDSVNAHANYRYILFGVESELPEIMVYN